MNYFNFADCVVISCPFPFVSSFSCRLWTSCHFFQAPDPSVTPQSRFCISHCPALLTAHLFCTLLSRIKMSVFDPSFTVDFDSTLCSLRSVRDRPWAEGQGSPSTAPTPQSALSSLGSAEVHIPFRNKMSRCMLTSLQFTKKTFPHWNKRHTDALCCEIHTLTCSFLPALQFEWLHRYWSFDLILQKHVPVHFWVSELLMLLQLNADQWAFTNSVTNVSVKHISGMPIWVHFIASINLEEFQVAD